ncbi:MAG TPA: tetratricopeptide repeat protein [Methylomirabilota bacterium]|nr:tetratricopeptide repeat protein [Methylomirabilota bacterium]
MTRPTLLIGALVVLLTAVVFLPALGNGFVNWDDDENFRANPHYRGLGPTQIRWMFTSTRTGHYIPITWLTLGLDYVLWGMNPAGYHATSMALHALNTLLVYALALRLLRQAVAAREPALQWGAAVGALFFGVHPLRVESVAWISERRDLVMGCFALLAVLAYLRAVDAGTGGRLDARWRWAAVGCFALALLSKSAAVGLPAVLVALDCYPLGRMARAGGSPLQRIWRLSVVEKAPFWLASGAIAVIMLVVGARRGLITPLAALGIPERLAISGYGLAFYVWKTLAPWALSPLYTLFRPVAWWSATYLVPWAAVLGLTAAAAAARRRWPAGITAWVCYVALLLPMLGLLHNGAQIAADRYTYLACIPWALLAGAGVAWCLEAGAARRVGTGVTAIAVGAAILLLVLFMALTAQQVGIWKDSVTLWRQAAAVEPDSDIPIFYLGWALADAGRFDEARAHFERARARVPEHLPWLSAQFALQVALVEERAGRLKDAESRYREVLALDPAHPVARIRLGALLLEGGERLEAEREWARALGLFPEWPRYQLAEIRAAVARVPAAEGEARGRLALALAILLERHRALEEAGEQYRVAAGLIRPGDPAQHEACERARRLAASRAESGPWPAGCGAPRR